MHEGTVGQSIRSITPPIVLTIATLLISFTLALTTPAWQHYDETTHFEAAHLIADRLSLPAEGDFDPNLRRQIAGSMAEHGFFEDGVIPNLVAEPNPVIGISQIDTQNLYYVYLAAPLFFLSNYDVTMQLYVARLFSCLLFVVVILFAHETAALIFGRQSRLRWLLPTVILLTPAFADVMSGLNNDVGAAAAGSILIWMATRIHKMGFTPRRIISLLVMIPLAVFTKSTVVAVLIFAVLMLVLRERVRLRIAIVAIVALTVGTAALMVDTGGAAEWISANSATTRTYNATAPDGTYVFRITREASKNSYVQRIPLPLTRNGASATYTVGAWMWKSGSPEELTLPMIQNVTTGKALESRVRVGSTPKFYTHTVTLEGDWRKAAVWLMAPSGDGDVFFDDITMSPGAAVDPGNNLIMNGSAELSAIRFRSELSQLEVFLRFDPVRSIGVLQSQWLREAYLSRAGIVILDSFWAVFGWGHIALDITWREPLRFLTVISLLLALLALPLQPRREQAFWFAAWLAFVAMWFAISLRGVNLVLEPQNWLPSARYGSPGIILSWLILLSGWRTIARLLPQPIVHAGITVGIAAMFSLGAQSYAVVQEFHAARTTATFSTTRASQSAWRHASAAIDAGNAGAARTALEEYAKLRPTNVFTQVAVPDLLASTCAASPDGAACGIATEHWRTLGGTTTDALQRAEAEVINDRTSAHGWLYLARQLSDADPASSTCSYWRINVIAARTGQEALIEERDDIRFFSVGENIDGQLLLSPKETVNCQFNLAADPKLRWANLWSNKRVGAIVNVPTAGQYVITATMAAHDDVSTGSLYVDDQSVADYTVSAPRSNPQNFNWTAELDAGWHFVQLSFDNDFDSPSMRRDLYIRTMMVDQYE